MLLTGFLLLSLLVQPAQAQETTPSDTPAHLRDVFAFSSNEDPGRLVVAFTATELKQDLIYQFNFDTNQDQIEDRVVQVRVTGPDQDTLTVSQLSLPERTGETISPVDATSLSGPISTHANPQILSDKDSTLRAFGGLRDEPRGGQEYEGKNIFAVTIELPLSDVLAEHKPDLDIWVSVYERSTDQ